MFSVRTLSFIVLVFTAPFYHLSCAHADGGWYFGASTGRSFIEIEVPGSSSAVFGLDESATAWKGFGGYVIDLPLLDFGIEGGVVDFGSASARFRGVETSVDASGVNLWGIAGADLGPLGVYGKLGAIAWSLDTRTTGLIDHQLDKSGTDLAYGIGAKFMLWSLEFRAEYEHYDVSRAENLSMLSVGASWVF
jgi:hypothetical protein